jgi:hypothetical protein
MYSNVKINFGEICYEGGEWVQLTHCRDESTVMKFRLHANNEFLHWLNIDQHQKAGYYGVGIALQPYKKFQTRGRYYIQGYYK